MEVLLKDDANVAVVSRLLPAKPSTAAAAHCIVCHKTFNPTSNGEEACVLEHDFFNDGMSQCFCGDEYCEGSGTHCVVCDTKRCTDGTIESEEEQCYLGRHVADADVPASRFTAEQLERLAGECKVCKGTA